MTHFLEEYRVIIFLIPHIGWKVKWTIKNVREIFSTRMSRPYCVVYWSKTCRCVFHLSSCLLCTSNHAGVNVSEKLTKLWKFWNSISRKQIDARDLRLYDSWFLQKPNEFIQFRRVGQFIVGFPCSLRCVSWKFPWRESRAWTNWSKCLDWGSDLPMLSHTSRSVRIKCT